MSTAQHLFPGAQHVGGAPQRNSNAIDAVGSTHPPCRLAGAFLLELELFTAWQAAQQATRTAGQPLAPMCCCSTCCRLACSPAGRPHSMPLRQPWSSSGCGSTSCGLSWLLQPARVASRGRAGRVDSFQVSDSPHLNIGGCSTSSRRLHSAARPQHCPAGLPRGVSGSQMLLRALCTVAVRVAVMRAALPCRVQPAVPPGCKHPGPQHPAQCAGRCGPRGPLPAPG